MFTNGHICFPMERWDYYLTVTDMSDSKVRRNKILLIQNCQIQNVQTAVVAQSDCLLSIKALTIVSKNTLKALLVQGSWKKRKG